MCPPHCQGTTTKGCTCERSNLVLWWVLLGSGFKFFCHCWSLLQRPRQASKSSSALQSTTKQVLDTNVVALSRLPMSDGMTTQKYTLHLGFGCGHGQQQYLPHLRFKKLQNHLHEISLVKGFSILPKSLP